MTVKRALLLAGSLVLPITLIVLLFTLLGITPGDLVRMLKTTPAWLLAAVLTITLANQAISVVRWRAVSQWLNPKVEPVGWKRALKATCWGSFLGQFLPLQLAMTLARWAAIRNRTTVGATLYEQLFDFVILLSGASAAILLLVFRSDARLAVAAFSAAILAGCLSIRWLFLLASAIASRLAASGMPGAGFFGRLIEPLGHASRAPASLLSFMVGWSALRLAILSLRVVLVASVFLGAVDWATVIVGYPVVGLALGVPVLPAGLGVAEWSLTGILVLAGATAAAAATTAAAIRVLNIFGLAALVLALLPIRMTGGAGHGTDRSATLRG